MLHPGPKPLSRKTNDLSCVLRVSTGGRTLLLTSDIEAVSENAMLKRYPDALSADVMTVPHHGSRTSSTPEFIKVVAARNVIFPVGYLNRFGHPKDDVVASYLASGTRLHRTDMDGALRVSLGPGGVALRHDRFERRRYWHARSHL